ncbi:MAG: helix-turn-helix domain-containing protein [Pseudomonadota bacterium]
MPAPDREWLTIAECAQKLAVSTKTIRRAIKRGELTAHKGRKIYRISPRDWRLYLADHWPEIRVDPRTSTAGLPGRDVYKSPAMSDS